MRVRGEGGKGQGARERGKGGSERMVDWVRVSGQVIKEKLR